MDNNAGAGGAASPTFFAGDTAGIPANNPAEHTKYMTFPQTHLLSSSQASYDAKTGVIGLHVPLADVGNPPNGTRLLSATAFTATSTSPQSATTLFNLIDAATPFDLVIGPPSSGSGSPGAGTPGPHATPCSAATGRLAGRQLGPLRLAMSQTRARRLLKRHSTHGRRHEDFFCLRPIGIRAGYGYPSLLRGLRRADRRRLNNAIVLILSANRRYTLRGIRPDRCNRQSRIPGARWICSFANPCRARLGNRQRSGYPSNLRRANYDRHARRRFNHQLKRHRRR